MRRSPLLPLLLFPLIASAAFGQADTRIRIAVPPIRIENEEGTFPAFAAAARMSLILTLNLLGNYNIVLTDDPLPNDDAVRALAESRQIDKIIVGWIEPGEPAGYSVTFALYDSAAARYILQENRTSRTVFDMMNVIDLVSAAFVDGLTGRHVGYGSLVLNRTGASGDYDVRLDDIDAGRNATGMTRIAAGTYRLSVTRERLSRTETLFQGAVTITEGETTTIAFETPYLTPEEIAGFLDRAIRASSGRDATLISDLLDWNNRITASMPDAPAIAQATATTSFVAGVEYCRIVGSLIRRGWTVAGNDMAALSRLADRLPEAFARRIERAATYIAGLPERYSGLTPEDLQNALIAEFGEAAVTRPILPESFPANGSGILIITDPSVLSFSINGMAYGAAPVVAPLSAETTAQVAASALGYAPVSISAPISSGWSLGYLSSEPMATSTIGFQLVPVQGGTFPMGNAPGGRDNERPVHSVTVSSFLIGATEVTQAQYLSVMGRNPSRFSSGTDAADRPVESVTWSDVVAFCNAASDLEGLQRAYTIAGTNVSLDRNANGYRLPTEAEWEYAARKGNGARNYGYTGSNNLNAIAWYVDNSALTTHPVGRKMPNLLGLFDMTGNVREWCWDWYGTFPAEAQTDPVGPASGTNHVLRGGAWELNSGDLRLPNRIDNAQGSGVDGIGFRVVRSIQTVPTTSTNPSVTTQSTTSAITPPETAQARQETPMTNSVGMQMIPVEGGTFQMGTETGGNEDEMPVHSVTVSNFILCTTEVTQGQYRSITRSTIATGAGVGDDFPVYRLTWFDAVAFCNTLSEREGLQRAYTINGTNVTWNRTANGYRLPTEAEWEYAGRGGNRSQGYTYAGGNNLNSISWNTSNSGNITHPVGQMQANELGLFDMSGNVREWCWDRYGVYAAEGQTDPLGAARGNNRTLRGGCCYDRANSLRATARVSRDAGLTVSGDVYVGFRVARSAETQTTNATPPLETP